MKVIIEDEAIQIPMKSISSVRKTVMDILVRARELSENYHIPDYYLTFLILMHITTGEYLSQMLRANPNVVKDVYDKTEKARRKAIAAAKEKKKKKEGKAE